jgi:hypothetical protein
MTNIFVQFSDGTETTIVSVFANAQDPATFPNQAEIASSDSRYESFYQGLQALVQKMLVAPGS